MHFCVALISTANHCHGDTLASLCVPRPAYCCADSAGFESELACYEKQALPVAMRCISTFPSTTSWHLLAFSLAVEAWTKVTITVQFPSFLLLSWCILKVRSSVHSCCHFRHATGSDGILEVAEKESAPSCCQQ